MPDFPSHLRYALKMLNYGQTDDADEQEARVAQFRRAWGGTDAEAFARAAQTSGDIFAVLALSRTDSAQAHTVLLSFLDSPDEGLRWASALGLGERHDSAALPVLGRMLAAYDPTGMQPYWDWPSYVPRVLARWGASVVAPLLRDGLEAALASERQLPPPPTLPLNHAVRDYWPMYQYSLVYALGRVGAFGVLVGVPLPAERMDVARVHLLVGSLHGQYQLPEWTLDWNQQSSLRDELPHLLERVFGLNAQEQTRCLHAYAAAYGFGGPYRQVDADFYGDEES